MYSLQSTFMPMVYLLSDCAIQIDWFGDVNTNGKTLSDNQLATIRQLLVKDLQLLGWPAFQCIQADQSLTLLFEGSASAVEHELQLLEQVNALIPKLIKTALNASGRGKSHRIAVNYGGVAGQDLAWLANKTGLTEEGVIDLHCSATYTVQFIGFLPGFAYLTGLPEQLHFPRRESPRAHVPAGTLAIGAHYCAVYPWESPGGWHLLGHVEQVLFDPERPDHIGQSLLQAGDTVQFLRAEHA